MSDSLLQRVAAGDVAAMKACIDEYSGLVWSLARRLSSSAVEAEDAVQEAFISLWENAGRFDRDRGAEATFVAMIARRRLIDRGRRTQRRDRALPKAQEAEYVGAAPSRDTVAASDEAQRAMEAMEQLSDDQQRVLRLAIHQGCTHEQIARITSMPLGTVKTHARRGLLRVRKLLEQTGSGASTGAGA